MIQSKHLEHTALFDIDGNVILRNIYTIFIDNHEAQSHNTNIDNPSYTTSAFSEAEAIGKMMQSDFNYKHKTITKISIL